ncbi:hypothetical protein GF336_07920, partial [Candidatus Woesearchaeota archaeon]|nr:hypothetical protein [Candidatus Woesearchaeota archaeon]
MKKFIAISFFLVICFTNAVQLYGQLYFGEDFESGTKPTGWTQRYLKGTIDWAYTDGGYSVNPGIPGSGRPPYAYEGDYNALFHYTSFTEEATMLITSPIDLEFAIKPELRFWHAQDERYFWSEYNNDILKVYYKTEQNGDTVLLEKYLNPVPNWSYRKIILPDTALSNTYYICFQATTKNGWGVCIDSVQVVETEVVTRYIDTIMFYQPDTQFVSSGTKNNPVLRIDFKVEGNDQQVLINDLRVTSLNSDDNDIADNGVKIYATRDTFFNKDNPVGTGVGFSGGYADFTGLNYELKTGYTSFWIT